MYRVTLTDDQGTVIETWHLDSVADYLINEAATDFPDEERLTKKIALIQAVDEITDDFGDTLRRRIEQDEED
jgi:hypothetical protein